MGYFIGKYWDIILYPGPSLQQIIQVLVPRLPERVKLLVFGNDRLQEGMIRLEI